MFQSLWKFLPLGNDEGGHGWKAATLNLLNVRAAIKR